MLCVIPFLNVVTSLVSVPVPYVGDLPGRIYEVYNIQMVPKAALKQQLQQIYVTGGHNLIPTNVFNRLYQ